MARPPAGLTSLLAGLGGGNVPPRAVIRPDYKIVRDLRGGINVSLPPDQIGDNESPDCLNVVFMLDSIQADFGVSTLGTPVYGTPLQPILWQPSGTQLSSTFNLLVTTKTLYQYSSALGDWVPIPLTVTDNPTITSTEVVDGQLVVSFTGTATWTYGALVAVPLLGGAAGSPPYLIGVAIGDGVTSPITIENALPSSLPSTASSPVGSPIWPLQVLTSDGSLPVSWTTDPQNQELIFVNGFDPLQRFNGTTCSSDVNSVAAGISTARTIARYHFVTVLGATTESGNFLGYRVRRSATGDSTNWTTLDAGFDDLVDTDDAIESFVVVNPYLIMFRSSSIVRASYYGIGDQVFWYDYGLSSTGILGAQAVDGTKTDSLLVAEPGIFIYRGDYALVDVGTKIFNAILGYTGDANPLSDDLLRVLYVPVIDETWVLYADQTSTWPNNNLRYSHRNGSWFKRTFDPPISFSGAGLFQKNNIFTWATLPPTRTWQQATSAWNARTNQTNFNFVALCGATTNQVYAYDFSSTTDDGDTISWYYVSKDYPLPENWETIDGVVVYGIGVIDSIQLSTNAGVTWVTIGTAVVMGSVSWARAEVDCSLTCQFVRLRLNGTDPSFRLSWFALKTMIASEH